VGGNVAGRSGTGRYAGQRWSVGGGEAASNGGGRFRAAQEARFSSSSASRPAARRAQAVQLFRGFCHGRYSRRRDGAGGATAPRSAAVVQERSRNSSQYCEWRSLWHRCRTGWQPLVCGEGGNKIGRITPQGQSPSSNPDSGRQPLDIALGPMATSGFTEPGGNKIGRITPTGNNHRIRMPTTSVAPVASRPELTVTFGSRKRRWDRPHHASRARSPIRIAGGGQLLSSHRSRA